jgi:hypothetical protein
MSLHISRRKILSAAAVCLALAAGAWLTWRGDLGPTQRAAGSDGDRPAARAAGDRAFSDWPVDQTPPPGTATRPAPGARSRAASDADDPANRGAADAMSALSDLAAGPAALPNQGRDLDAPSPTGLSSSMSAEERARLMSDRNATEMGTAPGPRRDRGGIRVRVSDDDQCVPRPPRPQFARHAG